MTDQRPVRDSVLDALRVGFGVLIKPDFLWAPVLIGALLVLPLAFVPGAFDATPSFADEGAAESYLQTILPSLALTVVVSIVLGPLLNAVAYRLGREFLDGAPAEPFGPGIASLAWRMFLQGLALTCAFAVALTAIVLALATLSVVLQAGWLIIIGLIAAVVVAVAILIRVALGPALLVGGEGPLEALIHSWRLTSGQYGRMFRWLVVSSLLVSLASALISGIVAALFDALSVPVAGQLLGSAVTAPLAVVSAIVMLQLVPVVSGPPPAPPPSPDLPDWMRGGAPPGPPSDPPSAGSPPGPAPEP